MRRNLYPFRYRVIVDVDVFSEEKEEKGLVDSYDKLETALGHYLRRSNSIPNRTFEIVGWKREYVDSIFDSNSKNNVILGDDSKKSWWKRLIEIIK